MARILLVDDDADTLDTARDILRSGGHDVVTADSLAGARMHLRGAVPDALLLDLMLPDGNGLELLEELKDSGLRRIVLITGHPGIKSHIRNLSGPSISYLTKPITARELIDAVRSVDEPAESQDSHFGLIVGEHETMRAIYEQIERVARTDMPVLIVGETGTGKELVAESIHRASRRTGAFVPVNCGSLSAELAASELFGHEKGSFTGASRRHTGAFERAETGTLFLDELAEMPVGLQAHFLRVLETAQVRPVGGERDVDVDARIVAATNRDPEQAIASNLLRQDLYFRLSALPIAVPPLRARPTDIPLLVKHFLAELRIDDVDRCFDDESMQRLMAYQWPGNARELKHVVQRTLVLTEPSETELKLPQRFESPFGATTAQLGLRPGRSIRDMERELIERTLEHFAGDKKAAAETLGISLNTLYNRLNGYRSSETR
jgi:two-component system, NtrC family, response regulator HydG